MGLWSRDFQRSALGCTASRALIRFLLEHNALVKENQQLKQKIAQLQEPTEDLQQEPEEYLSQDGPQQTM